MTYENMYAYVYNECAEDIRRPTMCYECIAQTSSYIAATKKLFNQNSQEQEHQNHEAGVKIVHL